MKNAAAVLFAVSLAGCGMLEAEAKSDDVCVLQSNLADVPAAPPGNVEVGELPVDLLIDMGAAVPDLDEEGVEVDINPAAITLGSVSGNADFGGVQSLTLRVQPPPSRSDLEPAEFRYQRPATGPASSTEISATPVDAVDLADYLDGDLLRIRGSFSGQPPQESWIATLELCGATRIDVDYWERITD